MTNQHLVKITDHPKIAVSEEEYRRIQGSLQYFKSEWDKVLYTNSNNEQKMRERNHLPIARTACRKIASLVYNEQAEILVSENKVANRFIQDQLKSDRFNKNFERYLESCLALGGLAMRPYIDNDRVRVAFIQAPVFLPLQSNTQDVSSAAIVTKTIKSVNKKNAYYTLIELHEWQNGDYQITNELYKSEQAEIVGDRVPLAELYEDLAEVVKFDKLSRPLFTYLKTPGMNNKDINSPLGLSVFDNAKSTIDFINTTYDEFKWEVRMGQRRVVVPEQTVRLELDQRGEQVFASNKFDPEQNVYMQVNGGSDELKIGIHDLTTPIRSDDYIKAINEGLALFEMQIGVSAGMFTFDGKSMKTATEIVSENSDTYQMRNSIVSLVEQSIKELVVSMLELASADKYRLYTGEIPSLDDVVVNLDDGVFTDRNNELDYWTKALASGLVSKSYAIQKVFGIKENEAQEMIDRISQERPNLSEVDRNLYDE
ncbi:phage portal protein [Streptococcus cuniculi]|nr:phage portal protein [Streptococcus cuniculi]